MTKPPQSPVQPPIIDFRNQSRGRIGMQNWGAPVVVMPAEFARQQMRTQARSTPDPFGERGVVLRPMWHQQGGKFRRPADFLLLRKLLLYWDVITWPQLASMFEDNTGIEPYATNLDFLAKEGALQTVASFYSVGPNVTQRALDEEAWRFQEKTYLNLELREPGQWAMAQSTTDFASPIQNDGLTADGALGSLTNLLPAPAPGVTYEEIIKFRRTNREALVTFRMLLDELNLEMMRNPDCAYTYGAAHRRLDASIGDVWEAVHAQRFETLRMTFGTALSIIKDGTAAGVGIGLALIAAPLIQFPLTLSVMAGAGLVGGLSGLLYLNEKIANPAERQGPTAYLLKAIDERIIEKPRREQ